MRISSQVVSVILHPLVMPTLGAICYYNIFPSVVHVSGGQLPGKILLALFVLTLLLPLACVFLMMRIGQVSTMFMDDQKERNWPLLMTAGIYAGAHIFILGSNAVPVFIRVFLLGAIITMILAMLINLRWKISLHMIGIGGLCGGLTVLYYLLQEGHPLYLAAVFGLAGLLGTARMLLNAHTSMQILAGFVLGFGTEFGLGIILGE